MKKRTRNSAVNLNKIRGLRIENGLSQKDLAKQLGISDRSYRNKEKGHTEFKPSELTYLSCIFNVNVEAIFF